MKQILLIVGISLLFTFLVVALINSVSDNPEPKETIQNGEYEIELLFEQNGCKMYRFHDNARWVYWSDCQGKTEIKRTESNGKTNSSEYQETITTE
jgi:hypothetical protein